MSCFVLFTSKQSVTFKNSVDSQNIYKSAKMAKMTFLAVKELCKAKQITNKRFERFGILSELSSFWGKNCAL